MNQSVTSAWISLLLPRPDAPKPVRYDDPVPKAPIPKAATLAGAEA